MICASDSEYFWGVSDLTLGRCVSVDIIAYPLTSVEATATYSGHDHLLTLQALQALIPISRKTVHKLAFLPFVDSKTASHFLSVFSRLQRSVHNTPSRGLNELNIDIVLTSLSLLVSIYGADPAIYTVPLQTVSYRVITGQ